MFFGHVNRVLIMNITAVGFKQPSFPNSCQNSCNIDLEIKLLGHLLDQLIDQTSNTLIYFRVKPVILTFNQLISGESSAATSSLQKPHLPQVQLRVRDRRSVEETPVCTNRLK